MVAALKYVSGSCLGLPCDMSLIMWLEPSRRMTTFTPILVTLLNTALGRVRQVCASLGALKAIHESTTSAYLREFIDKSVSLSMGCATLPPMTSGDLLTSKLRRVNGVWTSVRGSTFSALPKPMRCGLRAGPSLSRPSARTWTPSMVLHWRQQSLLSVARLVTCHASGSCSVFCCCPGSLLLAGKEGKNAGLPPALGLTASGRAEA
jgi:hypothetical protein